MKRIIFGFLLILCASLSANAQTMMISISSDDFQVTPQFNEVDTFSFNIEIDAPLAPGAYVNPEILSVSYAVSGTLVTATPSGFPAFALQRDITGTEFYAQGSSLSFEIGPNAVLSDGVQLIELVGNGIVFTFNGKEIGNGRYHPALFELNSDGTGQIQNSDNVISENPFQQVDFGEEYITALMFDPGNTTLIAAPPPVTPPNFDGGGGAVSPFIFFALLSLRWLRLGNRRRFNAVRRHYR